MPTLERETSISRQLEKFRRTENYNFQLIQMNAILTHSLLTAKQFIFHFLQIFMFIFQFL